MTRISSGGGASPNPSQPEPDSPQTQPPKSLGPKASGPKAQSAKGNKASTSPSTSNSSTPSPASSSQASPTAAATSGAAASSSTSGPSESKGSTKEAPKQGLASAAVQAGSGDVMVRPAQRRPVAPAEAEERIDVDDVPDDGPDMDADGPDAAGGFFGRVLQKGGFRSASKVGGADAGGDGDGGDGAKISGGSDGGGSSSSKAGKRGRSKGRGDRAGGKRGAGKSGGGGRVRAAEGRDKTEDVESVSVLVGQDEGGGDPVEQALNAHKRISGDDDEHKNAFTSNYKDNFDPTLESAQVERLGSIQGAVHMVRLADHWEHQGLDRQQIIEKTAQKLLGFTRQDQIKRTINEMNMAPIKNVYPLEVMLRILNEKPDFWPKVHRGEVLQNRDELVGNRQIIAGHDFRIKYPEDYKIKSFALLGGGEPGYEFTPYKNGVYRMVIDEAGTWTFALSAEKKGEAIIDSFTVEVNAPGRVSEAK